MYPELFQIGPFTLRSYSIITEIGIIVGVLAGYRAARRQGVKADDFIDLAIWTVAGGIIGARLWYAALAWEQERYWEEPIRILFSWEGGLVFQGAIFGGLLGMLVFVARHRLPFLLLADIGAVGMPLGHSIGRVACFFNGCCYGEATDLPWGVVFPFLDHAVHPTMLYESLANLGIFALIWKLDRRKPFLGFSFSLYLILYSSVRFLNEFLRGDLTQYFFGLRQAQVVSLLTLAAGLALLAYLRFSRRSKTADAGQPLVVED